MKSDDPADQNHRHAINGLIAENPADRAEKELQAVREHSQRQGKDDPRARQFWHAKHPIQLVGQLHLAGRIEPNPLAESKHVSIIAPC